MGTAMAVSFSQNWKACAKVMERIPPVITEMQTTTMTTTAPSHDGSPVAMPRVNAAPCSCGTM